MGRKANKKARVWVVILAGIILFCGTGLAITYFNHDVGMEETLERLFHLLGGRGSSVQVLALTYSIGVALGVLLFFNPPFRRGTLSPMELKYYTNLKEEADARQQKGQS